MANTYKQGDVIPEGYEVKLDDGKEYLVKGREDVDFEPHDKPEDRTIKIDMTEDGKDDEGVDKITTDSRLIDTDKEISSVEKIVYSTNKLKQPLTSAPTYNPTNFYDQFAHYDGKLYVNINNSWTAIGAGARARAYSGSVQSIPDNTPTTVNYDTENYDTDSAFNTTTHLFTCPRDGYYQVNASVRFDPNAAGDNYGLFLYKNSSVFGGTSGYAVTTGAESIMAVDIVYASAGDTLSAKFSHTAGVNCNITSSEDRTHITINEL